MKALAVQLTKAAPPRLSTTLGSTVASISTFIECRSTPPTSTATAGSQWGFNSAPQPMFAVSSDIGGSDHVLTAGSNNDRSYLPRHTGEVARRARGGTAGGL